MERRKLLLVGTTAVASAMISHALAQNTASSLPDRFAAALSAHDIQAFADLFAEDYVNHQFSAAAPAPAAGKSQKQASVDFFAGRIAGMPDLQVAVETSVVSGDQIAASFVYTGHLPGGAADPSQAALHLVRHILGQGRSAPGALGHGRHRGYFGSIARVAAGAWTSPKFTRSATSRSTRSRPGPSTRCRSSPTRSARIWP